MKTARLLTATALAALLLAPVAAWAQDQAQPAPSTASAPQPATAVNPAAPAASGAASSVAATTPDAAAPPGSTANPIPESSPTPAAQAGALTASDPTVVSNGPVPDTKANRARYGKPLSAAGRATDPAGN